MMLSFDLGASTGRLMLGQLAEGRLELVEVHRFPNRMLDTGGELHWDVHALFREMKRGLSLCAERFTRKPASIGIDTWGIDFGLLDAEGRLLGLPHTYRDRRTEGAVEEFSRTISRERIYELTGVQILPINTLFQLQAMTRAEHPHLNQARDLLFIPDLFNYFLTGVKQSEFTFATTSQLYNPITNEWAAELFHALEINPDIMQRIVMPGSRVGPLSAAVCRATGLEAVPVIAVASHDTASAVAAIPAPADGFAYISSGTWSLVGIEAPAPLINEKTFKCNFTNEGGVGGRFRVLKNITGLWLLEECRRGWAQECEYTHEELVRQAEISEPFRSVIDPDDPGFLNPRDMPLAIADYCRATNQFVPESIGELTRCVFESLALAYRRTLDEIAEIRPGKPVSEIRIIGGGSQNALLCQMTADATRLPVYAGPKEATAIGNLLVQAMADGMIASLTELREVVRRSFPPVVYEPRQGARWDEAFAKENSHGNRSRQ